jgi:hypothetical protein
MIAKELEFLRIKVEFDHLFAVDSVGRSGGLAMLWIDEFQVEVQNFSRRCINCTITQSEDGGCGS